MTGSAHAAAAPEGAAHGVIGAHVEHCPTGGRRAHWISGRLAAPVEGAGATRTPSNMKAQVRDLGFHDRWRCRESNPGPLSLHKGFSVRSSRCLYSDPPIMRTSRCDDPSRCLVSLPAPRPGEQVSPLADAGNRVGNAPGPTVLSTQPARAKEDCTRCSSLALISLQRVVNELIVAFLDTLPLDRRPESKPFTPSDTRCRASAESNARGKRDHPAPTPSSRAGASCSTERRNAAPSRSSAAAQPATARTCSA
jgi:hypothetical protein